MSESNESGTNEKQWQPIGRNLRRVFGVLIEKAKTTPDNYPLTVSGLIAGCKQKSNRDPIMDLDEDQVIEALDQLRNLGAVREVQGSGRVNKYRHCAYEWLDVTASEAAVMTELLLRGPQTLGELRARASRMEPFESLDVVATVVEQLQAKGLVEAMTPPGRGQTFGHTLYEPHERQKALDKAGASSATQSSATQSTGSNQANASTPSAKAAASVAGANSSYAQPRSAENDESISELRAELVALRSRVDRLEAELGIDS